MSSSVQTPAAGAGLDGESRLAQGPVLPAAKLSLLVDDYVRDAGARSWNPIRSFDWAALRPERLAPAHRSALRFITYIEDHIPGYLSEFLRRYPVDGTVDGERFEHNRELFRFYARWVQEEEAHAHVLFRYQVQAGIAEPAALRSELADVGRHRFEIEGLESVHAFTYTVIQEKATQLFYQQFARSVEDEVLREVLRCMARDEARHFAFFARVLQSYLEEFGSAVLPAIEASLRTFRMPLSNVLTRYWRWSIEIADGIGGYRHTDAYPAILKLLSRIEDASVRQRGREIERFIQGVCGPVTVAA